MTNITNMEDNCKLDKSVFYLCQFINLIKRDQYIVKGLKQNGKTVKMRMTFNDEELLSWALHKARKTLLEND